MLHVGKRSSSSSVSEEASRVGGDESVAKKVRVLGPVLPPRDMPEQVSQSHSLTPSLLHNAVKPLTACQDTVILSLQERGCRFLYSECLLHYNACVHGGKAICMHFTYTHVHMYVCVFQKNDVGSSDADAEFASWLPPESKSLYIALYVSTKCFSILACSYT